MGLANPNPPETPLLRGLVGGLTLVVILLGAAGLVAVGGARAIENDTADIVREQLVMARLLNEMQTGENILAAVLHQLAAEPEAIDAEELLRDLASADQALERVARTAAKTPESRRWSELHKALLSFSAGVRNSVHGDPGQVSAASVSQLFEEHDAVVRLEQQLLEASEDRVSEVERRIEEESRELGQRSLVLVGLSLLLAILCSVLIVNFARNSIRKIQWQAEELNRVSWHMLHGQEDTARRFSHELHDELGQSLAAVRANLISGNLNDWQNRRQDCVELVDAAIANVRELSQLLRPVILDDFGLDAGLRWLTEKFTERTGVQTDYFSTFSDRLPDETETHLFRIAQEALTNIARHSGATKVRVELRSAKDQITLSVEDNGRGLSEPATPGTPSLGMTGMRARARQAGGVFRTSMPPGGGLRIEVQVPRQIPAPLLEEVHSA